MDDASIKDVESSFRRMGFPKSASPKSTGSTTPSKENQSAQQQQPQHQRTSAASMQSPASSSSCSNIHTTVHPSRTTCASRFFSPFTPFSSPRAAKIVPTCSGRPDTPSKATTPPPLANSLRKHHHHTVMARGDPQQQGRTTLRRMPSPATSRSHPSTPSCSPSFGGLEVLHVVTASSSGESARSDCLNPVAMTLLHDSDSTATADSSTSLEDIQEDLDYLTVTDVVAPAPVHADPPLSFFVRRPRPIRPTPAQCPVLKLRGPTHSTTP